MSKRDTESNSYPDPNCNTKSYSDTEASSKSAASPNTALKDIAISD
jgi:hypothetical protein